MTVYADASLLVPLFTADAFTPLAMAYVRAVRPAIVLSDFASAEFASSVARKTRMAAMTSEEARTAFTSFDAWASQQTTRVQTAPSDLTAAEGFIRRLDLNLRAPDAINIAIAIRLGAELATFDARMADCARALGCAVAEI